jgi:hypothetical protein
MSNCISQKEYTHGQISKKEISVPVHDQLTNQLCRIHMGANEEGIIPISIFTFNR